MTSDWSRPRSTGLNGPTAQLAPGCAMGGMRITAAGERTAKRYGDEKARTRGSLCSTLPTITW
jgi:hypothetical protein